MLFKEPPMSLIGLPRNELYQTAAREHFGNQLFRLADLHRGCGQAAPQWEKGPGESAGVGK
jgi:hypothetical protein